MQGWQLDSELRTHARCDEPDVLHQAYVSVADEVHQAYRSVCTQSESHKEHDTFMEFCSQMSAAICEEHPSASADYVMAEATRRYVSIGQHLMAMEVMRSVGF